MNCVQKFKFNYDSDNDDLFIYSGVKSKGAVELGELVFDFDSEGRLVALEIMSVTSFLEDLIGKEIGVDKKMLESLKMCKVDVKVHQNLLLIKILLVLEDKEIPVPLSVPSVVETSPALKY